VILFLDSNALIYLIEGDGVLVAQVQQTIKYHIALHSEIVIAVRSLALLECRVHPLRNNDSPLLERYDEFFSRDGLLIVDLSRNVVDIATRIRSDYGLKTPDALQAACCLSLQTEHIFLTEDNAFNKVDKLHVGKVINS